MGEDYASRFKTHHLVEPEQTACIADIREQFIELADILDAVLLEGREKSIVMTKLEEACFFAVAAIAREDGS